MDSKLDEAKPAKPAEQPRPFLLEVTPNELVMPPTGNLEVKIRNPTDKRFDVHVYFDSFFWLMKVEGQEYITNHGLSNSMCYTSQYVGPNEILSFTIGYHDGKYKEHLSLCEEFCPVGCEKHPAPMENVPPCERKHYSHERPEGVLLIRYTVDGDIPETSYGYCECPRYKIFHECDRRRHLVRNFPTKRMDLYLKEETEEYKKYREQFLEIRKEQARRARWGHVLVEENGVTVKKFKDFDGTIREFGDRCEGTNDWEQEIPTDLKQFDALSDEEILKMRKERKEKFEEKLRKEEEETKKIAEEREKEEKEKKQKYEEELKEKQRKKREEEEKKEKEKEDAAAKEKSKVKTVEKSKRPEELPQKVPTSSKQKPTKSKVSAEDKKSVDKPNATKNKKKKANPCCSVM